MTGDTLSYSLGIGAEDGPSLAASSSFEIEGYDRIKATVVKNSVLATVKVQPSLNAQLKALMITADVYGSLKFTVDADPTEFDLDGPLCLIGSGPISLLGATVNTLKFTNSNVTTDRVVTVFCARTAKT